MSEIVLGICVIGLVYCFIMLIKNNVTFRNRSIISDAIYDYRIYCIDNGIKSEVDWSDQESYDTTMCRIWDWGYTRILPADKFEIIKPFIK